ncbi:MFS multidrug transporter [Histoplasma ohiense]|nr:MFS multidrug transporter [Histoplasma ohiense (nom. inval.)]
MAATTPPKSDIEKAATTARESGGDDKEAVENQTSSQGDQDELLVDWDGPDDPQNPLNWSMFWKWAVALLTSFGGLVTLMSGAMLAPALDSIGKDLNTSPDTTNMCLSIFVLAFAFGPMVLAPMTEIFGRRHVWIVCSAWYVIWNGVCGFATSQGLMLSARLLAGLGASAEFAVSNPVLGDTWRPEERGRSFAIATFIPLLGPAIGPILGGVITNSVGWRWLFWVLSIFDAILTISAIWLFPECYEQLLLHRKAIKLRKETGRAYHTRWDIHSQPLTQKLKRSVVRPVWMLVTQPIIQLVSLFLAYNFGTLYFVLTSFASIWITQYHQSVSASGLHYIALVIGSTIGAQLGAALTDRLWAFLKKRAGGETAPEYRIPLMIPGSIVIPISLFWFGWTAETMQKWIVVDIAAAVFNFGIIMSTHSQQQYVMEAYRGYMASATAASQFLRSIFAFAFPLFAPALFARLGYGWGHSVLAFVFLGLGLPSPFILWKFGAKLRAKGKPML